MSKDTFFSLLHSWFLPPPILLVPTSNLLSLSLRLLIQGPWRSTLTVSIRCSKVLSRSVSFRAKYVSSSWLLSCKEPGSSQWRFSYEALGWSTWPFFLVFEFWVKIRLSNFTIKLLHVAAESWSLAPGHDSLCHHCLVYLSLSSASSLSPAQVSLPHFSSDCRLRWVHWSSVSTTTEASAGVTKLRPDNFCCSLSDTLPGFPSQVASMYHTVTVTALCMICIWDAESLTPTSCCEIHVLFLSSWHSQIGHWNLTFSQTFSWSSKMLVSTEGARTTLSLMASLHGSSHWRRTASCPTKLSISLVTTSIIPAACWLIVLVLPPNVNQPFLGWWSPLLGWSLDRNDLVQFSWPVFISTSPNDVSSKGAALPVRFEWSSAYNFQPDLVAEPSSTASAPSPHRGLLPWPIFPQCRDDRWRYWSNLRGSVRRLKSLRRSLSTVAALQTQQGNAKPSRITFERRQQRRLHLLQRTMPIATRNILQHRSVLAKTTHGLKSQTHSTRTPGATTTSLMQTKKNYTFCDILGPHGSRWTNDKRRRRPYATLRWFFSAEIGHTLSHFPRPSCCCSFFFVTNAITVLGRLVRCRTDRIISPLHGPVSLWWRNMFSARTRCT